MGYKKIGRLCGRFENKVEGKKDIVRMFTVTGGRKVVYAGETQRRKDH